jgi:tetratricopeptide (TPR) repeat protein
MSPKTMTYNPAFLSEAELVEAFVVRYAELEVILQTLRENAGTANQHILVAGPRGMGKTTLVRRVAASIANDEEMKENWYPIFFGEESYGVMSAAEFWLEAVGQLANQTKEDRWEKAFKDLQKEKDDDRLIEQALGRLLDFADEQDKRLLLVVENFNMIFDDQLDEDEGWKIRHTMVNEPRIMFLASSVVGSKMFETRNKPMHEIFKPVTLDPLDTAACGKVLRAVAGDGFPEKRFRPIEILTGGNPRLLAVVASFAAKVSFKNLMDDLVTLVDEHTNYLKSNIELLSSYERKVFVTLAEIWDPADSRKVAEAARINVNKASTFLNRMVEKGFVTIRKAEGKKKWYQVTERLYNIYHLMRARGGPGTRVRAVVDFMVHLYEGEELVKAVKTIACEAGEGHCYKQEIYATVEQVLRRYEANEWGMKIFRALPEEFVDAVDAPEGFRALTAQFWLNFVMDEREDINVATLRNKVEKEPNRPENWIALGYHLGVRNEKLEESEEALKKALKLDDKSLIGWTTLGQVLANRTERLEDACTAFKKVVEIEPDDWWSWNRLGWICKTIGDFKEAEVSFLKSREIEPENPIPESGLMFLYSEYKSARDFSDSLERSVELAKKWTSHEIDEFQPISSFLFIGLASIVSVGGDWEGAFDIFGRLLKSDPANAAYQEQKVDFFVDAAAAGHIEQSLKVIEESPSAHLLEPLVVALKIMDGQDVLAAVEIEEVAKDVIKKIEARQTEMEAQTKPSDSGESE